MPASLIILVLVLAVVASTVTLIIRGIAAGKKAVGETIRLRGERHAQGPVADLKVRPLTDADRTAWEKLWEAYCDFYGEAIPSTTTDTTWKRMMDPTSPVKGFAACSGDGALIGLAHIVLHPHTWSPKTLCYLEDLYVIPAVRGRDVGHALITFLWRKAESEGWGRVYWHTQETNAAARRLYDRFRPADGYVRYPLTL